jgi:pimeloyl-ACP methyl ester carboxylesterase/uncharacterized membrane protein
MKSLNPRLEALIILLTIAPFFYVILVWNDLPTTITSHYNLNGQPDATMPKALFTSIMAGLSMLTYALLLATTWIGGLGIFASLQTDKFQQFRLLIAFCIAGLIGWAFWVGLHPGQMSASFLFVIVGALLAGIGNYLSTVKRNVIVGIRTPWTLLNESVWRKTHRLAGRLWVVGGLLLMGLAWVIPVHYAIWLLLAVTAVLVVVPVGYSFMVYQRLKNAGQLSAWLAGVLLVGLSVGVTPTATAQIKAQTATIGSVSEPVSFTTAEGLALEGTLTMPANPKKTVPVVLLIAGSGPTDRNGNSGKQLQTNCYQQLADSLAARGVAVLRYDKRGSGTNLKVAAGKLNEEKARFDNYVVDAVGFVAQLKADKRFSKVFIAGHSEGSLVGMLAARQTQAAGFISVAGAGRNIAEVLKVQLKTLPDTLRNVAYRDLDSLRAGQAVRQPNFMLLNLFRPSVQPYLMSWMQYDPAQEIKRFSGPVLIIQGKHDIQVAVSEAEALKAARLDAKLVLFDEMGHILKNAPADRAENIKTYTQPALPLTPGLAGVIAEFVSR